MTGGRERTFFIGISILLAVLLWVYVVGQKEGEWPYTVPVSIELTALDVVGTPQPDRITVVLRGPRRLLHGLEQDRMTVMLSLAEAGTGDFTRTLIPSMLRGVPQGVEIVRMEPSEAVVSIKPLVTRKFGVTPRVYVIGDRLDFKIAPEITLSPPRVEVRGSKDEIARMGQLVTEELYVEAKLGRRSNPLRVVAPPGITVIPSSVTVDYEVIAAEADSTAIVEPMPR